MLFNTYLTRTYFNMISTIFQRFVISTFPIYTYFNVILTPGFTDEIETQMGHVATFVYKL